MNATGAGNIVVRDLCVDIIALAPGARVFRRCTIICTDIGIGNPKGEIDARNLFELPFVTIVIRNKFVFFCKSDEVLHRTLAIEFEGNDFLREQLSAYLAKQNHRVVAIVTEGGRGMLFAHHFCTTVLTMIGVEVGCVLLILLSFLLGFLRRCGFIELFFGEFTQTEFTAEISLFGIKKQTCITVGTMKGYCT